MTSRDFCYWLQGYFEVSAERNGTLANLTEAQVTIVRRHLALVFKHEIDPSMGNKQHQSALNKLHAAKQPSFPNEDFAPNSCAFGRNDILFRC